LPEPAGSASWRVESGHQFAVGGAGGGEVLVAFLDLQTQVGHVLFEVCDLLVEGVDVGWRAEPGLAPDLLAEGFGQTLFQVLDSGVEPDGAFMGGKEVGLQRGACDGRAGAVAGGRAKRRKLAQAVTGRPAVLADGRSPAPRVVADLLIALVAAGAVTISPPLCAECGKALRTLQRRGEHWYCGACGPLREPLRSLRPDQAGAFPRP
jgi:hypothetical protein